MRGYAYLDLDGTLNFKPSTYVDYENPGFWKENEFLITLVWRFDTDDMSSMYAMYSRFKSLKLKSQTVLEFSQAINFDIEKLTAYANSLQSKPG